MRSSSQFARFESMSGEMKLRLQQLQPVTAAEPSADMSAMAPLLHSSYMHMLELKGVSRALANHAELTKGHLQAVSVEFRAHSCRVSKQYRCIQAMLLLMID